MENTCGGVDDRIIFWKRFLADGCIVASQRVLEEIFSKQEMVVIEKVHIALTQGRTINPVKTEDKGRFSIGSSGNGCLRVRSTTLLG